MVDHGEDGGGGGRGENELGKSRQQETGLGKTYSLYI